MKVVEFKNIMREEGQIFYIRKYACDAVLEFPTSVVEAKIMFTVEVSPFGERKIDLTITQDLNYPLLPLRRALKEYIATEDTAGHFPC